MKLAGLSLAGCLVLMACSPAAPNDEASSAAAPPPVAPAYDPWPGRYEGDLMVRISPIHKVTLVTANSGCSGDIGLAGGEMAKTVAPDHLRLTLTAKDASASAGGTCTIDLIQQGDKITVSEGGDCSAWHGPTCAFSGTATRLK